MNPEEIIKYKTGHPEWQNIKSSNPEEYQRLSRNAILNKFEQVLPHYLKWQRKIGGFIQYMQSIPSIIESLESIDLSMYERSAKGKKRETSKFFSNCISYGVEEIIDTIADFDEYRSLKIKNLINRAFQQYYSHRCNIVNNIQSLLDWDKKEVERIQLLAYIPFQNSIIGIDWMLRRTSPTMSELLEDWLTLLCFDTQLFLGDEFINRLKKALGEDITERLRKKLFIHIAKSENEHKIFNRIIKKYGRQINKYRNLLCKGQIVEDIKFGDLHFNKRSIGFYKCRMPIQPALTQEALTNLEQTIDPTRLLSIFISAIPYNGVHSFRPIFNKDMEYLMGTIKNARNEASIHQYESLKSDVQIKESRSDKKRSNDVVSPKSPSHQLPILATNVPAFKFKIREGIIEYTINNMVYYFRSVKISQSAPESVLERIEHYFTLVKDRSIVVNDKVEGRFYFEPANDLSYLLAEIERLSTNQKFTEDKSFPQTGEFEVPWRFVHFYEGVLSITHPNPSKRGTFTPFHFRNSDILKSFEDIRLYIEKKSPKLRVQAADGVIIGLLNFKEFMSVISQYKDFEKEEDIGFGRPLNPGNLSGFTKEVFQRNSFIRKSPYLSYLATLHNTGYNILYLLERVIHESGQVDTDEYGYLFVIKKTAIQMILLYENITDSSRSSIVFYVDPENYTKAVEIIRKFLAGEIKNKRQKLAFGQIRFNNPCIREVKRIKHTDLIDWKYNIQYYL